MNLRIRRISVRFALLLAAAAVVPLLAYGFISLMSLERGTRQTVIQGNLNVATRAAEEIRRYVTTNADLLKALSADLQDTGLSQSQQDRILKNYVLQVREFREITLFDEARQHDRHEPHRQAARARFRRPSELTVNGVTMSPIRVDEDLLPTTTFALHLTRLNQPSGWLVGEFSLEEMWRMVDRIRIGESGYAMVIAPDGELVAHGDPDKKALVAQATNMSAAPLVAASRAAKGDDAGVARIHRRRQPQQPRRRRAHPVPRLDRHRRTADQRGVRHGRRSFAVSSSRRSRSRCSA